MGLMDWISGNKKKREEVYKTLQNANVFYRMADIREKGWRVCAENIDNMECTMAFPIRYFTCIQRVFCKVYSLLNDKKPQKENKSLTFVGEVIVDIGVIIKKLIDQLNCNSEIKDLSKKFQKLKVSDFSSFNHEILKDSRSIKVINLWGKNLKKLYYSWADFEEYMNLFTINVNLQINQIGDARSIDVAKKHYGAIANFVQKYGWIYRDEFKKKTLKNQRIFDISFKAVEVNNVQYCSIKNIQLGPKIHLDFPSDITIESMIENLNLIKNLEGERYSREFKSSVSKAISNIEKLRRQQEQPQQFEQQPQQPEKSHEEQFEVKSSESELLIAETSQVENTNGLDKLNENHRLTPEKSKDELSAPELGTETKSNDTNPEEKAHDSEQEPQDDQLNDEISRDARDVCDFSKDALDYLEDIREEIKPVLDGLQAERYEISCDAIDEDFTDALDDLYNNAVKAYNEAWKVLEPLKRIYEDNKENVSTKAREWYNIAEKLFEHADKDLDNFDGEQSAEFSEAIEEKINNFKVAISSLRTDLNEAKNIFETSADKSSEILEKVRNNRIDMLQELNKFLNIVFRMNTFLDDLEAGEKKYFKAISDLNKQIKDVEEICNVRKTTTTPEGVKEVTPPDSPTETQPVIETYDDLNNQVIKRAKEICGLIDSEIKPLRNDFDSSVNVIAKMLQLTDGYKIVDDISSHINNVIQDYKNVCKKSDEINNKYLNEIWHKYYASHDSRISKKTKDFLEKIDGQIRNIDISISHNTSIGGEELLNVAGQDFKRFEKWFPEISEKLEETRKILESRGNASEAIKGLDKAESEGMEILESLGKISCVIKAVESYFLDSNELVEKCYQQASDLQTRVQSAINKIKELPNQFIQKYSEELIRHSKEVETSLNKVNEISDAILVNLNSEDYETLCADVDKTLIKDAIDTYKNVEEIYTKAEELYKYLKDHSECLQKLHTPKVESTYEEARKLFCKIEEMKNLIEEKVLGIPKTVEEKLETIKESQDQVEERLNRLEEFSMSVETSVEDLETLKEIKNSNVQIKEVLELFLYMYKSDTLGTDGFSDSFKGNVEDVLKKNTQINNKITTTEKKLRNLNPRQWAIIKCESINKAYNKIKLMYDKFLKEKQNNNIEAAWGDCRSIKEELRKVQKAIKSIEESNGLSDNNPSADKFTQTLNNINTLTENLREKIVKMIQTILETELQEANSIEDSAKKLLEDGVDAELLKSTKEKLNELLFGDVSSWGIKIDNILEGIEKIISIEHHNLKTNPRYLECLERWKSIKQEIINKKATIETAEGKIRTIRDQIENNDEMNKEMSAFKNICNNLRQLCKELQDAVMGDHSAKGIKTAISCNLEIESKLKEMRRELEKLQKKYSGQSILADAEKNASAITESITTTREFLVEPISKILEENELASQGVNTNIAELAVNARKAFGQVDSEKVSEYYSEALKYPNQIEEILSKSEDIYSEVSRLRSVPEFSNACNDWDTKFEGIRSVKETVEKEVKGIEEYVEKTKKAGEIIKELEEIEQRVTEESRNLGTATIDETIDETVKELKQQLKEEPSLEKCLETLRGKTRNVGNFMQNWINELNKIKELEFEYNKVVNDAIESTNEKINEEMEKAKKLIGRFNALGEMIKKKIKELLTDPSSDDDYDDYDDSGNSGDSGDSGSSEEASEYSASTDEEDIDEPSEDDLDNETTDEE